MDDVKYELNITDYALTLACEHIAEENPLIFSLVGKCTISIVKEHFLRQAKMLLEVKKLTEGQKNDT